MSEAPATKPAVEEDPYGLPDSSFDPELDALPDPPKPKPRDEAGRFVPEKHSHSSRLVRMAADLGLAEADITEATPETLEALIHDRQRQLKSELDQQRQEARRPSSDSEAPAPPVAPNPLDEIKEDEFIPEMQSLIKVVKGQDQVIKELRAKLATIESHLVRQENASKVSAIDKAFSKHEAILGKGRFNDLKADSPFMARRNAVDALVKADKAQGSLQDKVDRAMATLYGDKAKAKKAQEPIEEEASTEDAEAAWKQEWRNGGVARPTQRNGAAEPRGPRTAERAVAAALRAKGAYFEGDEESSLPG